MTTTPPRMSHKTFSFLSRLADGVAASLLAVIFIAFILQIALRYLFNWPVGWTAEASVIAWLWLVLFGSAFALRESEEIRIDFIYANVGWRLRRVMGVVGSLCIVVLLALSLPASYDYVSFMKVEKTSYLKIRFDWLYAIYLVFVVAVIARHLIGVVRLLRGRDPLNPDTQAHSAL